jgi:transcriptional regulator PpsR
VGAEVSLSNISISPPDVVLGLDLDGVVRTASLSNVLSPEGFDGWLGRPWSDTVGRDGIDDIRGMIATARHSGVSDVRKVTQLFPSGLEVPIEYTTVRLGGRAGLLAVGKNLQTVASLQASLLAAQRAREQDSWRLREVQTLYRLLFEASTEPVLLIRGTDHAVVESNAAVTRVPGLDPDRNFLSQVAPADRPQVVAMLERVREQGRAPGMLVHVGREQMPWIVRASLTRSRVAPTAQESTPDDVFLLQLTPGSGSRRSAAGPAASLEDLLDRLPDGLLVTDFGGAIRYANRAFLDLVQAPTAEAVLGEKLGRWLDSPQGDAAALLESVLRHRVVRSFTTTISGSLGMTAEVEISAAGDPESLSREVVVMARDISRRLSRSPIYDGLADGQEGRPLQELVRKSRAHVERMHIEDALTRAGGNRTIAASLLGLSRQSLYVKLVRHGLHRPRYKKASDPGVPALPSDGG